jgi:heptosyltransferase II
MAILCVCPIGIGNYLMCYPAFAALKRHRPDCPLHMVALRHGIASLAKDDPLWDGIDAFDPDKIGRDIGRLVSIITRLHARRFDASLTFFPSNAWQYFALPLLCGIRRRYGFRYARKRLSSLSFLCTDAVAADPSLHDVHQNLRLASFFLGEALDNEPIVFPRQYGEADEAWAKEYVRGHAGPPAVIAVHPGSSVEHGMGVKRWPAERFARLADEACRYFPAQAFIFGSADESGIKQAVAAAMTEKAHIVEPVQIGRTAALLSKCTLALCNDSGIMHMAACMGVPTVGIFGPTDEKRNGPWGDTTLVIRKQMAGFPLWTVENVGDRSVPAGVDPSASLAALTAGEAWEKLRPWLEAKRNIFLRES